MSYYWVVLLSCTKGEKLKYSVTSVANFMSKWLLWAVSFLNCSKVSRVTSLNQSDKSGTTIYPPSHRSKTLCISFFCTKDYSIKVQKIIVRDRAVRLIEIEIKSRFEIARFLNRFIARFFPAPLPQPPAVCYPNQSECSRTEQTCITCNTDRQCAKETGKMSSEQHKDLVAKKNACCMQSTQRGVAIMFPSEQRASFWRSHSARSAQNALW